MASRSLVRLVHSKIARESSILLPTPTWLNPRKGEGRLGGGVLRCSRVLRIGEVDEEGDDRSGDVRMPNSSTS